MDGRKFLKFSVGSAAGAAIGASLAAVHPFASTPQKGAAHLEIPTTCEMCVNKCSVIAVVEDGVIHKLNPNPENPKSRSMLCARGNAGLQQVYDSARLKRPLIRAGERGDGKWRPGARGGGFGVAVHKPNETTE